eukprot:GILI01003344.1.p1 GENE.GILI01003344.1~~GILI01003344.1.p1  ORF type:complete len:334 (+),score=-8.64 GILI01003344.1:26-1027(+)
MKHPLLQEIDTFLNRKLKLVLADAIGISSELTTLCAQLYCASADGDIYLLSDVIERIRKLPSIDLSNPPPFSHRPFGLLHYAAFSNDPKVCEMIFLNQSTIEKLVPVNPDFAATVPTYSVSIYENGRQPHTDPTSIHYFTHLANGEPLVDPDIISYSTALHVAAANCNVLICRLLVACGGNVRSSRTCLSHNGAGFSTKRLATPLFDTLQGACVKIINSTTHQNTLGVCIQKILTVPTPAEKGGSGLTILEYAERIEKQSCLNHPVFSTIVFMLNAGGDSTLLSCPHTLVPQCGWALEQQAQLNLSVMNFLSYISDLHAQRSQLLAHPLLQIN